ncbi:MAG: cyclase family protein, partial [Chlamydiales bacterium]|nr:cyclase family protein [Chlamydiales bacterium]
PHLTGSHIESARHVFGDGACLIDVIRPYCTPLAALHVQLEAQDVQIDRIEQISGVTSFIFSSGDTYSFMCDKPFVEIPNEYVITKAMLIKALGELKEKVVLICVKGHEKSIHDWPYLTNEAVDFLVEKSVEVIGLNIPSFDREKDGGYTSNHKRFFEDQRRIIVESLALEHAPLGRVTLTLNPEALYDQCVNTVPCDPNITL